MTEAAAKPGSRRRRKLAAGVAAAALFGAFFVGVPWVMLEQASTTLGDDACTASKDAGPPSPEFFVALRKLETVGWFPGFRDLADDVREDAMFRCLGTFSIACQDLRYETKPQAEDWGGFCEPWRAWVGYAEAHGVSTPSPCAPCSGQP